MKAPKVLKRYFQLSLLYFSFKNYLCALFQLHQQKLIVLTDKNAQKLIEKIIDDIDRNGVIVNTLVSDLKELRPYAVAAKRPVVVKAVRLLYEHIEEFEIFSIAVPNDEEIVDDESGEVINGGETETNGPTENLKYMIALIRDESNRRNKQELREFNEALIDYAEEFGED